jgi:signal transduction histidine kinase
MNTVRREPSIPPRDPAARGRMWRSWFEPDEPHPSRGPLTRWPLATDSALALIVFAVSMVTVALSALDDGEDFELSKIGDRPVGAILLLALAAAALPWRRQHPLATTGFVSAVMIGWAFAGYGDGQDLALIVAVYSVGRYTIDHLHSLATATAVVAVSLFDTIIDTNQRVDIIPAIILTGLPWYIGRRVRNRGDYLALLQERAERLEAEQHARARQAVADERSRIARELHDVVAHQVSMMTVQAGAAKTIARDDLDTAIDAMGDVERAGRQALGELRHLLGVLRPDTADPDELGPQSGLADIATLTDQLGHTGADITLTVADLPDALPAAVDLSAYRIVQESFTNIVKHAGPDPTVEITIDLDDDGLAIVITNTTTTTATATTTPRDLPGSGYGIVGMRERATQLGGTLTAGPLPPDRYRVCARLPLETEPT